ncbi:hypothetical protein [Streptomyces sp. AK010]|uniref:pectate lyase family protein n=1 Tax=Streptomyces sp. AK010 TaxID=2723074 RepID=UPI001610CBF7|nr:hypothetical protein [Streptomyces sp. AK010]MBB6416766.1 pectate lyase [Streptomyces sp. AK010]
MRLRQPTVSCSLSVVLCVPAHAEARDIGRDTLPANDGWAAEGAGTTGGAAADDAHVFTVTDRAGLVRALDGGSDTPKNNIWLTAATHVWVDHVTLSDKGHPDAKEPTHIARNYLRHYGPPDITNGSDLVTVSWSRFTGHDKAMLIGNGNGDTATGDRGELRVTLHHNAFESVVQRAPRVRFGQVHVHNNRYDVTGDDYRYSLGVPTESRNHAENNAFHAPGHVEVADLVKSRNGSALHQSGTLFDDFPVDLLAIHNAYNSGSERDLTADVGWTPALHGPIDSARAADRAVARGADAGRIP